MGLDFIRSKRQSRRKSWNYQVLAGGHDLLATVIPKERSTCRALMAGAMPNIGDRVLLQLTNGKDVMVRSQNALTGQVSNPKPELIENLQRQRGVTTATVAARLDRAKAIDLTLED
jgi:hypothetical protein